MTSLDPRHLPIQIFPLERKLISSTMHISHRLFRMSAQLANSDLQTAKVDQDWTSWRRFNHLSRQLLWRRIIARLWQPFHSIPKRPYRQHIWMSHLQLWKSIVRPASTLLLHLQRESNHLRRFEKSAKITNYRKTYRHSALKSFPSIYPPVTLYNDTMASQDFGRYP